MIRGIATFDFQLFDIMRQEKISIDEACMRLKTFGYTHIEVGFPTLTEENLTAYRKAGFLVSNIFYGIRFDQAEEAIKKELDSLILRAAEVNAPFIMPLPQHEPEDLTFVWKILQSRAPLAEEHNVTMILEDFDFPEQSYRSIAGVKAYLDNVPAMRCCFDTGNFQEKGDTMADGWNQLGTRIVHIHLKDRKDGRAPTPVGTGTLGLLTFVQARLADGYDGIFALEQCPVDDQLHASYLSINNLKRVL